MSEEPRYITQADAERWVGEPTREIPPSIVRAALRTVHQLYIQRHALAKLSSDEPLFGNPLTVWETHALRDAVLANPFEIYTTQSRETVPVSPRRD
jgi:hypothetical protein